MNYLGPTNSNIYHYKQQGYSYVLILPHRKTPWRASCCGAASTATTQVPTHSDSLRRAINVLLVTAKAPPDFLSFQQRKRESDSGVSWLVINQSTPCPLTPQVTHHVAARQHLRQLLLLQSFVDFFFFFLIMLGARDVAEF